MKKYFYVELEWSASDISRFIALAKNEETIRNKFPNCRYITIREYPLQEF